MCGICGFTWKDEELINRMIKLIKHRGPDDLGIYVDDNVSFGHSRLSVLDLTIKGHQPMKNCYNDDNQLLITYNGEIYNYIELKKILQKKGHIFETNTDTEVILKAYENWGPDCVKKFNGMFAFCIYDKKNKLIFLVRDRFGIKPLYYKFNKNDIVFASEIKCLLIDEKNTAIDKEGFRQYMTFRFTIGETTMFQNIKKVEPGNYLIYNIEDSSIKKNKYYHININIINRSHENEKKILYNLLDKAVNIRMRSDIPISTFLSGGIDSTIITYFANKYNNNMNTFCMSFETTNEMHFAKIVSNYFNTNHHNINLDTDNMLSSLMNIIHHMDEPIGDAGFLPIYYLSKNVKKHNSVVLSGDGADELFCGYDRYKLLLYGKNKILKIFLKIINKYKILSSDIVDKILLLENKDEYEAFLSIIQLFDDKELKILGIKKYNASKYWPNENLDLLTKAMYFDIQTLLPNDFFMKADKMSSAFGLEQRIPFMDHNIVEFAFTIPINRKLKLWNEKIILKKTFKKHLPKKIIKRRKHGFNVPVDYWFKNELNDILKNLIENSKHNLYNKEYVFHMLNLIKKQKDNYKINFILAQKLWSLLVFELWYKYYIDNNHCIEKYSSIK